MTAQAGVQTGEVWLIGAGPGDPDLLTVRALRLIQRTDVALYDNLVSPEVLALLPAAAERIYVGKRRREHALPQELINQRMIELARAGKCVARLKGGDPFVFGRGSEELTALAESGIRFEVVPGITAAIGAAAYTGIPLTDRRYAQTCILVTAQRQDGSVELDWPALARPHQTLAIYMGLAVLPTVCAQLIAHGLDPQTPAAVIQQGTTPRQRVVAGTLVTLPELVTAAALRAPTMILVGEVVSLYPSLSWFQGA